MEHFLVFLIIAAAGWYAFKTLYKSTQKDDGCGCTSCPSGSECGWEIRELTGDDLLQYSEYTDDAPRENGYNRQYLNKMDRR